MSTTEPNLISRTPNHIQISMKKKPGISKYRLRAHHTLTGAYTASDALFEVVSGRDFLSPTIQKKGAHMLRTYARGDRTLVAFDPMDYYDKTTAAVADLPHEDQFMYLRVEEYSDAKAGYLAEGPCLVIPPVKFLESRPPMMTLTMVVPKNAAVAADVNGLLPTDDLVKILIPYKLSAGYIQNMEAHPVYYTTGNAPMIRIPDSGRADLYDGACSPVCLATTTNPGVEVTMMFNIVAI